jgi:hypothetical protein
MTRWIARTSAALLLVGALAVAAVAPVAASPSNGLTGGCNMMNDHEVGMSHAQFSRNGMMGMMIGMGMMDAYGTNQTNPVASGC